MLKSLRLYLASLLVPEDRSVKALCSLSKRIREADKRVEYYMKEAKFYENKLEEIHEATNPYKMRY